MAEQRFGSQAARALPSIFGPKPQPAPAPEVFGPLTEEQSVARFGAAPSAEKVPVPTPAVQDKMTSIFGSEDPAKAYLDSRPMARLKQGKDRFMGTAAERIQKYVQDHPEDVDLLNPAPLSSWAKSIGKSLAKVPFRVARFAGKYGVDENPLVRPFNDLADAVIPDSMLRIPTMEDTVTKIAAYAGLPLDDAKKVIGEKPTILDSLYKGFIQPVKDGFQIATMPNGPAKEEAFDAWAYKTHQAFVSGLAMGTLDEAMKENSIWLENGELMWRGVPIDDLTELENKGVAAGQLTGQMAGSMVTYALMTPMLTAELRNVKALDNLYRAHPYASSAILTNAAQEGLESVVRKGSGQQYTFNDTIIGMMSGILFETGKLATGGYKVDIESPDAKMGDVDIEQVRGFLNDEIRTYTMENGHPPSSVDLRSQIGDKIIPGTRMTINELHTMAARSNFKEARMIELKGGKKGRPGMDFPAEPPKPEGEFDASKLDLSNQKLVRIKAEGPDGADVDVPTKGGYVYRSISPDQLAEIKKNGGVIPVNDEGVVYWAANPDEAKIGSVPYGGQGVLLRVKADDLGPLKVDPKMKGGTSVTSGEVPAGRWEVVEGGDTVPAPRFAKNGKVKQVFRTDKFNIDEAGEARLKAVQETLGMTERGTRSWKEVSATARDLGVDPNTLLKKVTDSKLLSDTEVEALRQNVQAAHEFLAKKYDLLEAAKKAGDEAAVRDIEQKVVVNEQIINSSVKKLIGGGTELGRAVAIYRKIADLKMDDPTYWYKEALRLIDDGRNKVRFNNQKVQMKPGEIPSELRQAIDSMMKNGDQLGMAQLMAQLKRSPNIDKAITLWKAGLLTSPTTDLANILGNTTMMALETVKDAPATVMDILLTKGAKASNAIFGTEFSEARVKANTAKMLGKQLAGLYEGTGKAKEYLFTGVDADDIAAKFDISHRVNYNNAILQGYTDAVFRKLGAEDLVFRYGFIRRSLMESAQLRVKNMSPAEIDAALKGLPEGAPQTRAELVRQFYANPSDDASVKAINDAEYGTFQRQNPLADAISGAKRATSPGVRGFIDFIAPFTRTPTNIGFTIFDYSPAGFLGQLASQLKNGPNKTKLVNSFGRSVVGTSVIALGAALNKEGLMTGNAPATEAERKMWEAERKQPNSIYINGKWHNLDRISPIGNLLTIGAEFNELGEKKTRREQWTQIGFEGIKSVTEQSFLLGVSNALKAITEPDRFLESAAENAIRGLVPNIIAKVGAGMDDYERDVGTLNPLAVLQERIPILRESLPVKQDVLGRDIKMQSGVIGKLFNPFSSRKPSDNPVIKELSRIEQTISAPNRSLYSDEEFNALVDYRGKLLMPVLDAAFNDDGYQSLTVEQQREVVKQIDAAITRKVHEQFRMAQAQRIREELSTMSASDREKKLQQIKKKNNTVYTLIQLLDATQ